MSDNAQNLWQRINAVRGQVTTVAKDKDVGYGENKYSVATHESVNKMLRPLLVDNGLIDYVSLVSREVVDTTIRYGKNQTPLMQYRGTYAYTVIDVDSGESVTIQVEGHGDDTGDKGPGKAATYAMKTGRSKVFSISTGEDEEGRTGESTFTSKQTKTAYWNGLRDAASENDSGKARELWNELDNEQREEVWRDLSSGIRSTIKSLLAVTATEGDDIE